MSENSKGCNCDHDHGHDHQHEHGHENCDCNHDHEHHEPTKIYLTLTDGKKLECDVLDIFEVEDQKYIALLPSNSEAALLYGFSEENGEPELRNIESDKEYEAASKAFMERQEA